MDAFLKDGPDPTRAPAGDIRVLRLPQVCQATGLCRSSIYQMEAEGRFPSRVKIGTRSVGWIESELQSWLRERMENSPAQKPPSA
jgi:prophage regulatory protein